MTRIPKTLSEEIMALVDRKEAEPQYVLKNGQVVDCYIPEDRARIEQLKSLLEKHTYRYDRETHTTRCNECRAPQAVGHLGTCEIGKAMEV